MPNFFLRCLKWTAAALVVAVISVPLFSSSTAMAACMENGDPCVELYYDLPNGREDRVIFYPTGQQQSQVRLSLEDPADPNKFTSGPVPVPGGGAGEQIEYTYIRGQSYVSTSDGGRIGVKGVDQLDQAETQFERDPSLDVEGTGTGPGSYDNEKDCELAGYFWQEGNLGEGDRCVEKPSCATEIGNTGWIICPLLDAASGFADALWGIFETLMFTNPLQNAGVKNVWVKFRDVANALLVVVFIIIVMSQVSNIGISNYGIKKMLPRLVIVAVAVNISYVLLQVVVDLANIIGLTVDDFLNGVGLAAITDTVSWGAAIGSVLGGVALGVGGIAVAVTAVSAGLGGPLLILIALLMLPAILAFIAGLVALMFRAAILPILAVLAPIALVAYVLPNTQSIFDKWRKLFTGLLFLYPLAAIYYGGLKMGAFIIAETMGWLGPIVAVFVLFFGAGAVVILAIKSNSIAGKAFGAVSGVLGKVATPVQKLGKDVARDKAMDFTHGAPRTNRLNRFVQRTAQGFSERGRRRSGRQAAFNKIAEQDYQDRIVTNPEAELGASIMATPTGQGYVAALEDEQTKRARLVFDNEGMDSGTAMAMLRSGRRTEKVDGRYVPGDNDSELTSTQRKALRSMVAEAGNADHIAELWNQGQNMDQSERNSFANDLSRNKPVGVGRGDIANWKAGNFSEFEDVMATSAVRRAFSAQSSAGADASEFNMLSGVMADDARMIRALEREGRSAADLPSVKNQIVEDIRPALTDTQLGASKNRDSIQSLINRHSAGA